MVVFCACVIVMSRQDDNGCHCTTAGCNDEQLEASTLSFVAINSAVERHNTVDGDKRQSAGFNLFVVAANHCTVTIIVVLT